MIRRLSVFAVLTAAGLALAAQNAASAGAAVTVGQTGIPNAGCGGDDNIVQASTDPASTHTLPSDGVVTSWSFRSGGAGQPAKMIVWRPTAMANQFVVVGKTDSQTFGGTVVETFMTRIPVQAGDLLGMRMSQNGQCLMSGAPAGNLIRFLATPGADVPDGSTQTMTNELTTFRILVATALEPDADHDGFGDETQDQCLGTAGPENGCAAATAPTASVTGQRAAALKKCKKKFPGKAKAKKRKKCKKKANLLPV